jgi:hypothetical protein
VGGYTTGAGFQTLIERWNGTSWKTVASPNPGGPARDNFLEGVTATSAGNAWAVGSYGNGTAIQTLIEHWNGTSWKKVASPDPGGPARNNFLAGVAATAAGNAWAVGKYFNGTGYQTMVLHWNGTSWKKIASPDPAGPAGNHALSGVAAT